MLFTCLNYDKLHFKFLDIQVNYIYDVTEWINIAFKKKSIDYLIFEKPTFS